MRISFLRPSSLILDYLWFADSQPLAKYIASLDARYNSLFMDNVWKEAFEHSDTSVGEYRHLLTCTYLIPLVRLGIDSSIHPLSFVLKI